MPSLARIGHAAGTLWIGDLPAAFRCAGDRRLVKRRLLLPAQGWVRQLRAGEGIG